MVISGDVLTFHDRERSEGTPSRLAATARLLVCLLLIVLIAAVPAEAARKKKRVRAYYAPPQAAMVVDLHTGKVLFEENADKARFPASIT
jgi:D-alanyl-D-alanine carboxypeptidase